MWRDVHQHVNTCKSCIQFLPNRIYMQLMHLEILQLPFTGCAMDSIGQLPTTSKGNRFALTFICFLLASYLITVLLKTKTANEVWMAYVQEILLTTSCSKFILQDNGMEFKNEKIMSVFDTLGIKRIYSNPHYPRGNSMIKNVQNFLKQTIAKFMHGSQLKLDDTLPLATYCYNIAPSVDDLESPFHLVHGSGP